MNENKRKAKAFVDKYFPLKQQSTSLSDALDRVGLPSNSSSPESSNSKKQGSADGHTQSSTSKSRSSLQKGKGSNPAAILWEVPESCLAGSAVGYGSRDYYSPNPPSSNRHVGNYSYEGKDKKGGHDHKASENATSEWWQGSHNY